MARGEIPGFPLIVRRPELIDDGYLPQHLRDPRPMAEALDAPVGFHVANWRSQDFPATDTPEAFLEWLRYVLQQLDSWERPGSLAESLADAGYTPAHLDWAKELHDAYVIVRVLQDHRGYPAFDRDEPAARDLVSARTNLRAIRDWVRTNMPEGKGQDPAAGCAVETSQPQAVPELPGPVTERKAGGADYPTPENHERDKWIYEQRKAGRTIPEIIRDLTERPEWYLLNSDNGIRDAVKRYANYARLPVPRKRPGKPRGR